MPTVCCCSAATRWRLSNKHKQKEEKIMNIKKIIANTLALAALTFGFSVANIFGQTNTYARKGEATLFGMHTMAAGQTLRLAVVNRLGLSDREIVPCIRVRIVFDIYESDPPEPVRLRFVRRVEREMELEAGEAISFDIPSSRTGGERVSLSVFATPEEGTAPEYTRGTLSATLEVRETGRTVLTLPGIIKGFDPQPDPPQE
jgi:hypothetical protein